MIKVYEQEKGNEIDDIDAPDIIDINFEEVCV